MIDVRRLIGVVVVVCLSLGAAAPAGAADVVTDWNVITLATSPANPGPPL